MITMAGNMSVNLKSGGEMNIMSREKRNYWVIWMIIISMRDIWSVSILINTKKQASRKE